MYTVPDVRSKRSASMTPKRNIRLASYFILEKRGKILVTRRVNTGYEDGKYAVPSGKVDPGETFTDAVVREAKEELNIVINPQYLQSVHIMHRRKDNGEEWLDHYFLAKKWGGMLKNNEPHKCDDLCWCSKKKLHEPMITHVTFALQQIYLKKKCYSEYGW